MDGQKILQIGSHLSFQKVFEKVPDKKKMRIMNTERKTERHRGERAINS